MIRAGNGWLAVPAVVYLALLFACPVAAVLMYSGLTRDFYGGVIWTPSAVAWQMATDAITLRILARTLLLAVGVTALNLLIAYPCAALLARLPRDQRTMWVLVISFPLMTSLLLRTYGWLNILPLAWRGTLPAVALVLACNYLPFMLLPLVKAYERADGTLLSAALDLGATPWQAFWRVTLPITKSGAISGAMLVFIPVTGEYLIPHFIGDGKVSVVGTVVMSSFDHRNWPYAAACAAWLAAIILVPIVVSLVRKKD
ncbi:MAG: ABC transporter permease [Pirellulaceae bacterium]|nr:ABC transporter permease [Pirellulaceae bacterium]